MFQNLKIWFIEKLGGFPTIEDAIEEIREKDRDEKYEILTTAVKKLFNALGPEDILQQNERGQWLISGREMSKEEANILIAEAQKLLDSKLWKILQADVKYQINKKMYVESKTQGDMIAGKLGYYIFDVINTRLKNLKSGIGHYNIKRK